ncbi:hypothetical protein HYW82_00445 [Candidatus Peregrinibacteria bacterium]|nr:hypothetical protein [Candidatus Peregrinibacteria bacterium]
MACLSHISLSKNGYSKPFFSTWKCDIKKFFDNVNQEILLKILSRKIKDSTSFNLLKEIIYSFMSVPGKRAGIPIGNISSYHGLMKQHGNHKKIKHFNWLVCEKLEFW